MSHPLSAFIPQGLAGLTGSNGHAALGAAMVVDISGSTRLAEHYCLVGPAGIESFRRVIANTFSQQINCIYAYGGEVVYFSGDALVAYWPAGTSKPAVLSTLPTDQASTNPNPNQAKSPPIDAHCVSQATDCASALMAISQNNNAAVKLTGMSPVATLSPRTSMQPLVSAQLSDNTRQLDGTQPLPSVHIGVGYGELHAVRTQNRANSRLLLAGDALINATQAMTTAIAGEIRLSPQAKERARLKTTPPHEQFTRVANEELSDPGRFVSPNLHRYLVREHTPYSEAIRHISCLYFRVHIDTHDANDAALYQSITERAQIIISGHCAGTGNFVIDHLGVVIKVYLGVPNDTYRNNCQRLVTIGQQLATLARSLKQDWCGGVATGKCFCDTLGTMQRKEYIVTGFPMFLAARLCEGTLNELTCSTDVAERLVDTHTTEYLKTLRPKGFTHDIRVMSIVDILNPSVRRAAFYGRVQVREKLINTVSQPTGDMAKVVYITGDAGVGKSTFIDHFLDQSAPRLIPNRLSGIYRVANRTSEYTSAFTCWLPVVDECGGEGTSAALIEQQGVTSNPTQENAYSNASRQVMDSLLQVLSNHMAARALVVLEDVHWMDTASWTLLERLVKARPDLCYVCASRPVSEPDELKTIRRSTQFIEINLQGLDVRALESVVNQTLPFGTANDEIIELVKVKTQGNPFFIRELVRYLEQSGAIEPVNTIWVRRRDRTLYSDTIGIAELIAARIDQLSHSEREVLQACSILQQHIQPQVLLHLLSDTFSIESIESTLESLLYNDYLRISADTEDSWAFVHDLLRESIYEMLPPSLRIQLHTRAAIYFEASAGADVNAAQLTYHWNGANHPKNTIHYGERAAREALQKGACQETVEVLSLCLQAWQTDSAIASPQLVIHWLVLRCAAWSQLGNHQQRLIDAREVVLLAGRRYPKTERTLIVSSATKLAGRALSSRLPSWLKTPHPSPPDETLSQVIKAHRHATYAGFFLRTPLDALYNSLCAVNLAEAMDDKPQLAGGYAELGGFLGVVGLRKTGYRYLDKAKKLSEDLGELASQAHVYMSDALFSVGMGDWTRSQASAESCREAATQVNDRAQWCTARTIDFWRLFYQGQLDEALALARSNEVDSRNARHYLLQLWAIHHQILCLLYQDRPADALAEFSKIDKIYIRDWTITEDLPTQALRVLCLHRCGDEEDAFARYRTVVAIVKTEQMTARHSQLEIYSAVLEYHFLAKPFYQDAHQWSTEALMLLKTLKKFSRLFPIGKSRLHYWQARLAMVNGKRQHAKTLLRRAKSLAASLSLHNDLLRLTQVEAGSMDANPSAITSGTDNH